jgi:ribonucleoside-diphosphate reductase subunit M1
MLKDDSNNMYVTKRNGRTENVQFDKITERIQKLINQNETELDATLVAQKTVASIFPGISTEDLDIESAKKSANLSTTHPLYSKLAGRILVSNLHKKTQLTFVQKMNTIQEITSNNSKNNIGLLNCNWLDWLNQFNDEINNIIDYNRDYNMDFFGFKTLERAYLLKDPKTNKILERPQDMWMRVATFLNQGDLENTKKTYDMMSQGYYTHASPTLYNSGSKRSQMSSCFLIGTDDCIEGITKTWSDVSKISKWAGGIGIHVSNIRAKDSIIRGTNGPSSGIIPMLQVYNNIARYINQGGKRKGSFAIYLEPHHPDILDFLELRKNFGAETERARDLFLALWISDEFMKQVENDGDWFLMCPDKSPGLNDVYGDEFKELYWKYVKEKKYNSKISARKLFKSIMDSQIETGNPYILFKDSSNKKSNQKNIGTIKSSNLCAEILEYSDDKETAVCNLASIAINKCIIPFDYSGDWIIYTKENCNFCKWAKIYMKSKKLCYTEHVNANIKTIFNQEKITFPQILHNGKRVGCFNNLFKYLKAKYDFNKLYDVAYTATRNLDAVIDINFYPTNEAKKSNMRHRPIGLGIQGLADTLVLMGINFESQESLDFNSEMMETIYYAAMKASNDIAKERNLLIKEIYNSEFKQGCYLSEFYDSSINPFVNDDHNMIYHKLKLHKFEFDQIDLNYDHNGSYSTFKGSPVSTGVLQFDMWNVKPKNLEKWNKIKEDIKKYGVRNSLVTALMPTASTSQILGNNECFEFFTNNIYTRRTLAGDFTVVNKYLVQDLIDLNLWSNDMKQKILADDSSVQNIKEIPDIVKKLYKIIWEIKQSWVLKNAKARAPFVDQTQSMNIFIGVPDYRTLYSCHMWSWKNGLKTGMYYLRSKPSRGAIKFTVDPNLVKKEENKIIVEDEQGCEMCSA